MSDFKKRICAHPWLGGVTLLSLLGLICIYATVGLTEQEAYYWTWSKNLDWSYFDHPPLHAWTLALTTFILGDQIWAVRLIPIGAHIWALFVLFRWAQQRFGSSQAWIAVFFLNSTWFITHAIFSVPDSLLFPLAIMLMVSAEQRQVFRTALFLGLAVLAKWHAVLLIPGIVYCFWSSSEKAKSLQKVLIIGLVALLLQAPVLFWNLQHDWVSFKFHFIERHAKSGLSFQDYLKNGSVFLILQFLMAGPALFLALIYFLKNRKKIELRFSKECLAWVLPIFFVFFISALRGESRIYWTGLALVPLSLLFAEIYGRAGSLLQKKLMTLAGFYTVFNIGFLFCVLCLPVGTYLKDATQKWGYQYNLRYSPRGDFFGWKMWLDELKTRSPGEFDDTVFVTPDFHLSSKLMWALKDGRAAKVMTYPNSHEFQFFKNKIDLARKKNFIFVEDNRYAFSTNLNSNCRDQKYKGIYHAQLFGQEVKTIQWTECGAGVNFTR